MLVCLYVACDELQTGPGCRPALGLKNTGRGSSWPRDQEHAASEDDGWIDGWIDNFLLSQTQKDIGGKLRVGNQERLTFFGQVQLNSLHSIHREVRVKGNFSHQLEVKKEKQEHTQTIGA